MGLAERAELVARLTLQDNFTGGLNNAVTNANQKALGLSGSLKGVGVAAGVGAAAGMFAYGALAGAIGKVGDFTEAATKNFIEDEKSVARLGAALKANIQSWDGNTKAIEGVISARMRLGFTDEDQRNSLGTLLAATGDVTKALEIQRVAMDLAAFSGKDLGFAVDALTKVEAGSFRILKSLGIELKEGATQADALAAVMLVAGGAADALANTTGGKLTESLIRSGEAAEKFGSVWAPISVGIQDAQTSLLEFAARGIEGWQMLGKAAGDFQKERRASPGPLGSFFESLGFKRRDLEGIVEAAAETGKDAGKALSAGWTEAQRATIKPIKDAYKFLDPNLFTQDLAGVKDAMWMGGAGVMSALAAGISARRDAPLDAFDTMVSLLKSELTGPQEWARLKGQLFSAELARGMNSKDGVVKAQAEVTLGLIQTRLLQIGGQAELAGLLAGTELATGLSSKDTEVRNAAEATKQLILGRLQELKGAAGQAGTDAAEAFKNGFATGGVLGKASADLITKYGKGVPAPILPAPAPMRYDTRGNPLPGITIQNFISGQALSADQERQETYQTRVSQ